jgi:hypothetical protein
MGLVCRWHVIGCLGALAGCFGQVTPTVGAPGTADAGANADGGVDGGRGPCQPCTNLTECQPRGLCLQIGGSALRFCTTDCSQNACPSGSGAPARQCIPASGSCASGMLPGDAGAVNLDGPQDAGVVQNDASLPPDAPLTEEEFCVEETNYYRGLAGVGRLTRLASLEAFATEGARVDGLAHTYHLHIQQSGAGIARAENENVGGGMWRLSNFGSLHELIRQGVATWWNEPSHRATMTSDMDRYAGCGYFINGDEVTLTEDFRPP